MPEHSDQIKDEASDAFALQLSQIQTTKVFRHRNGDDQRNRECDSAAPSPDSGRDRFDREQHHSHHAKTQRQEGIGEQKP